MASSELIMSDRLLFVEPERAGSLSAKKTEAPPTSSAQRCDFCGVEIDTVHRHLFDRPKRSLICVCQLCYSLFTMDGAGGTRFRPVPQRYVLLADAANEAPFWDALQIPDGLSVLFTNGATGLTTACCLGSTMASEVAVPLDAWRDIERALPLLETMAHDVEALLVRRTDGAIDAAIVPIDACYELLGRLRQNCPGVQRDSADVGREIEAFFARLAEMGATTVV